MAINFKISRLRDATLSTLECTLGILTSDALKIPIFTLEDKERAVKIDGKTAIPTGKYTITYNMSNRFRKMMTLIQDVPNFSGVRVHSGNTIHDTEGCILLGMGVKFSRNANLYELVDSREAVSIFELIVKNNLPKEIKLEVL